MRQTKKTYLAVTAMAKQDVNLCDMLAHFASGLGCQIEQSRMALLGDQHAAVLLLSGNWGAIAKFEAALPHFQQKESIKVLTQRTDRVKPERAMVNYFVQGIAQDQPTHIENVTAFFAERGLVILDLYSTTYTAQATGTDMLTLNLTIQVPADDSIAELREEFMIFCDELNLDAIMEAER